MIQVNRLAEAHRVSIFEYIFLPVSAFFGYMLWGEVLTLPTLAGMVLIALSGIFISLFWVG
ncbi:MAG: hypothetical protein QMC17_07260 [Paracoccaceae bacterium]